MSEQVNNDNFERGRRRFQLFFIDCEDFQNWFYFNFRPRRDDGDSDDDGPRRKERRGKKRKDGKNRKQPDSDDGLSAKQRRKVVSKATISSSEGSDSEGAKKLRIDE